MASKICLVCDKVANKRCENCLKVYYCSKEHLKQDWGQHKQACCSPFKVAKDPQLGRHLVANRDIKMGELLLDELPLMRFPRYGSSVVCLSCLKPITEANSAPCIKCKWPLCLKESCRQSEEHLPECNWASICMLPVMITDFKESHAFYSFISILRLCYAHLHQPELWARLCTLEKHTELRKGTIKYITLDSIMVKTFLNLYDLEGKLTEEVVMDMVGIIEVNSYQVTDDSWAIYDLGSLVEHSCLPNCNVQVTETNGKMFMRAGKDIAEGEHVSITYTKPSWGTTRRFDHLQQTKHFSCRCVRCSDNTEMGSYFSAILCQEGNCHGPMLPMCLYNLAPSTPWICERCGATTPNEKVQLMLESHSDFLLNNGNYSELVMFLQKWEKLLHRNHHYLFALEKYLIKLLKKEMGAGITKVISDDKLDMMIKCCRHVSELLAIISPGEWCVRGEFKIDLFQCLTLKLARIHSKMQRSKVESAAEAMKRIQLIAEMYVSLREAYICFTNQPNPIAEEDD